MRASGRELSAWLASKDAIAQQSPDPDASADLPLPATSEQVLLALDRIATAAGPDGKRTAHADAVHAAHHTGCDNGGRKNNKGLHDD